MRGETTKQSSMLCLMSPESRVPAKHPLRRVKALAEAVLQQLCPLFDEMYSSEGRPSIPPERLLKATLLMALYTVRSERLFCEQLDYNMLFRWFHDMDMTEESFDASTFSKNRERLIKHDVAGEFFRAVVEQARAAKLLSTDHFTVDGTLIEAWASLKSFRRKDGTDKQGPPDDPGNPTVNFHGEKRGNETHESTTDPESRLARKGYGKEAKLCYAGHALMENRNGLLVDLRISQANGRAECETAIDMLADVATGGRITVAGRQGLRHRWLRRRVPPNEHHAAGRPEHRTPRRFGYRRPRRHEAAAGAGHHPRQPHQYTHDHRPTAVPALHGTRTCATSDSRAHGVGPSGGGVPASAPPSASGGGGSSQRVFRLSTPSLGNAVGARPGLLVCTARTSIVRLKDPFMLVSGRCMARYMTPSPASAGGATELSVVPSASSD
jgi:transposase